jgi:hypothetical protein
MLQALLPIHPYSHEGLDRLEWDGCLRRMGEALSEMESSARLVLIGAVPLVLAGQPGRSTRGLDVWMRGTRCGPDIFHAARQAGFSLDRKEAEARGVPYLNIISPGPSEVGYFTPLPMALHGALEVLRPPAANLIAGKLRRGFRQDALDIAWLLREEKPDPVAIAEIVATFQGFHLLAAQENLARLGDMIAEAQLPEPASV